MIVCSTRQVTKGISADEVDQLYNRFFVYEAATPERPMERGASGDAVMFGASARLFISPKQETPKCPSVLAPHSVASKG